MATILIVEDDADLVETYTDLLESFGHSIGYATNLSKASAYALEMQPAIITLDLNLPGSSNSDIAAFIQAAKRLCQAKIIIISGHAEMIFGQDWANEVDLVLIKPVDNQHLMMMIDRLLLA